MIKVYKNSKKVSVKMYGKLPQVADLPDAVKRMRSGDESAKEEIILGHVSLAGSIACTYAYQTKRDAHELMGVAMLGLCDAVERIRRGSCPHEGFGPYINKCVNGRVSEFISYDYTVKPPDYRINKERHSGEALDDYPIMEEDYPYEFFESTHFTPREREIFKLKYDGYTYEEIAEIVGMPFSSVRYLIVNLRPNVEKWIEENM